MRKHPLFVCLAWVGSLCAQQLQGPVSGFLFDPPTHTIRPILGFRGAAYLGGAVASNLQFASVAPNGKWALAVQDGHVILLNQLAADPVSNVLEDVIDQPDRVVWSPDSTAAVLYAPSRSLLQRVSRLDESPVIDEPVDLSPLAGVISRVAVDQMAQRIVVGIQNAPVSGLYLVSGDAPVMIAGMDDPGALFFSKDGDLYAAGVQSQRIIRLQNVSTSPAVLPFLDQQDGITDVVDIALSRDGKFFYVASGGNLDLRVYDAVNRSLVADLPLDVAPTSLSPLSGPDLLILNTRLQIGDQILLMDTRSISVYFVPVPPLPPADGSVSGGSEKD